MSESAPVIEIDAGIVVKDGESPVTVLGEPDHWHRTVSGHGFRSVDLRPVVTEHHEGSRRYPNPLVAAGRIKVDGFTIALDSRVVDEPDAAGLDLRLFQFVYEGVERLIRDFELDARARDAQSSHGSSSSGDGQASEAPDVPVNRTLDGTADTGSSSPAGGGAAGDARHEAPAAPEGGEAS